jgi:hypothetical protein
MHTYLAMILMLLAIVAHLPVASAPQFREGHSHGSDQRDTLVCGAKEHIELKTAGKNGRRIASAFMC